jgi:membrane protease YdiL (CAAX protease family)
MKEQPVNDRAQAPGKQRGPTKALALFLASFFIAWSVRATLFYFVDERIHSDLLRGAYANVVKFALWVLPAVAYVALADGREPLRFLKIATPVEGKRLLYAGVAITLFFAGVLAFEHFASGKSLAPLFDSSPRAWLLVLAGVAFSPVSEEILYRGFILGEFWERIGFWGANLLAPPSSC